LLWVSEVRKPLILHPARRPLFSRSGDPGICWTHRLTHSSSSACKRERAQREMGDPPQQVPPLPPFLHTPGALLPLDRRTSGSLHETQMGSSYETHKASAQSHRQEVLPGVCPPSFLLQPQCIHFRVQAVQTVVLGLSSSQ
jgi:hypothetical protein